VPEAQKQAFLRRLEALGEVVRRAAHLNPPLGFQARARADGIATESCNPPCSAEPMQGQLTVLLYPFVDVEGEPQWGGDVFVSAQFVVNDLERALDTRQPFGELTDATGQRILVAPLLTGHVAGFPVYNNDRLVLARRDRDLWAPVSRGTFLRSAIHQAELRLAEYQGKPTLHQEWEQRKAQLERRLIEVDRVKPELSQQLREELKRLEEEVQRTVDPIAGEVRYREQQVLQLRARYDGMSEEQRRMPAYYHPERGEDDMGLAAPDTPGARPLVSLNSGYFDPAQPPSAFQIVVALFEWGEGAQSFGEVSRSNREENPALHALLQIMRSTDWRHAATVLLPGWAPVKPARPAKTAPKPKSTTRGAAKRR
jgi:hypothetical protein